MPDYEIGVVYQRGPRYYIAVSTSTLISYKNRNVIEIRPHVQYDMVRSVTVERLCELWEMTIDEFDELMSGYLKPPEMDVRTRPRGLKRGADEEEDFWKKHRTGRFRRSDV